MVKRFFAVFGLVMLFMAVLAVILLAAILLAGDNDSAILVAVLAIFVVGIAAFFPYFDGAVKRAFRFQGEGAPVPEADLRAQIQILNQFDAPVMVEERKGNLVATWRYVDAKWWELLAKAGHSASSRAGGRVSCGWQPGQNGRRRTHRRPTVGMSPWIEQSVLQSPAGIDKRRRVCYNRGGRHLQT